VTSALLSPEARLLLALIAPDPAGQAVDQIRHPEFQWQRLVALAVREKATPALQRLLELAPDGAIPADVRTQLAVVVRKMHVHMFRLEQLLLSALDTLHARDIDVMLLKGAGLAVTAYGSFAARPMYDLDLLVRKHDALRAWQALRSLGWQHDEAEYPEDFYATHYHLPPLRDGIGSGLGLEVHDALSDGAVRLDAEVFFARARQVDLHGRTVRVPGVTHQVLHLATHFAWTHGMGSAGWRTFRDLHHLIASGIDWDAVVREAEEVGASASCYWTFRLAHALAGVQVPADVLHALRPPRSESLLRTLERHYATMLFEFSPSPCPSVRMTQLLWTIGMAPRAAGQDEVRPWHRGLVWAQTHGNSVQRSVLTRLLSQLTRARQWARYLGNVVMQRNGAALPPVQTQS
jgi:hypothetical protein